MSAHKNNIQYKEQICYRNPFKTMLKINGFYLKTLALKMYRYSLAYDGNLDWNRHSKVTCHEAQSSDCINLQQQFQQSRLML